MAQEPATTRLTRRRRCVLYLRAAGWDAAMIARKLGITTGLVRKDIANVTQTLIPGVTDGPEPAKGYRVVYVLGLLDAGVEPEDVPDYLHALEQRSGWLLAQERAGTDDDDNPLARVAGW